MIAASPILLPFLALMCGGIVGGCASPQSHRLRMVDMDGTVDEMISSLDGSEFLGARGPQSPQVRVVLNRVTNLTHDIIPESEQWMLVARVVGAVPLQEFGTRKNVVFLIAPEWRTRLEAAGFQGLKREQYSPTHVLQAEFRSAAREERGADGMVNRMSMYYYLRYQLASLSTGETIWTHKVELRRAASGVRVD